MWCADFAEDRILERFGDLLMSVPFSSAKPGFTYLMIRAVDSTETPVFEQDLRAVPLDAAAIIQLSGEHLHSDCSYEVQSHWDLWGFDIGAGKFQLQPHALEILCRGEDYDGGSWREDGHLQVNFGFEHAFTGHAGLLGIHHGPQSPAESLEEAHFLEAMAWPETLERYQEKTRDNISRVFDWVRQIEKALPVSRFRLWSEGEENLEARMEEILAAR